MGESEAKIHRFCEPIPRLTTAKASAQPLPLLQLTRLRLVGDWLWDWIELEGEGRSRLWACVFSLNSLTQSFR